MLQFWKRGHHIACNCIESDANESEGKPLLIGMDTGCRKFYVCKWYVGGVKYYEMIIDNCSWLHITPKAFD
jgi:hypothetical protein